MAVYGVWSVPPRIPVHTIIQDAVTYKTQKTLLQAARTLSYLGYVTKFAYVGNVIV